MKIDTKALLAQYRERTERGKFVHSIPEIALRFDMKPGDVVAYAIKRGEKKRVIIHSDTVVRQALADYVNHPEYMTKDIAKKYGVSPATLTVWAEKAGIPLRIRGVKKLDEPTAQQKEILELASIYPYEQVATNYGITRARVGAIVKRWKNWIRRDQPPFVPGDIVEWHHNGKSERLTVIEADTTHGTMLDSRGRKLRAFTWDTGGRLPKKVGFSKKYAVNGQAKQK